MQYQKFDKGTVIAVVITVLNRVAEHMNANTAGLTPTRVPVLAGFLQV